MLFSAASAKEPGFQKSSKKQGRAINKRDAGNATKAGELGILCFLPTNPKTIFMHARNRPDHQKLRSRIYVSIMKGAKIVYATFCQKQTLPFQ